MVPIHSRVVVGLEEPVGVVLVVLVHVTERLLGLGPEEVAPLLNVQLHRRQVRV